MNGVAAAAAPIVWADEKARSFQSVRDWLKNGIQRKMANYLPIKFPAIPTWKYGGNAKMTMNGKQALSTGNMAKNAPIASGPLDPIKKTYHTTN